MASYDIIVKLVDQTKAAMAGIQGGLKNIESQSKKTNDALGNMGNVVNTIASGIAALKITDLAKNFGDLEVRVRAASGSGAQTAQVMGYLAQNANRLGADLNDVTAAFTILRAQGIDASSKSLDAWAKLAVVSGTSVERIADAVGNVYQGQFGKISKATEDLISVEERAGSIFVKAAGQQIAVVGTYGQAADAIKTYATQNAAFADAFERKTNTITAAWNRLKNTVSGNVQLGNIDQGISKLIDGFTKLLNGSGVLGKALDYIAKAINFLGDNIETITTVVEILGSIFLVGKLFQGIKLIGTLVLSLGNSLRSLGYIFTDLGSVFGGMIRTLITQWKSWYTQITGAAQPILGIFDALTRGLFVTLGTLVKNIGTILKGLAAPFTIVLGYISGLFDPILDKVSQLYEGAKNLLGIGSKIPAAAPTSPAASALPPLPETPAAAAGTNNPDAKLGPIAIYIRGISEGIAQAKAEAKALGPVLDRALKTGNLDLASAAFSELSSRAEKLGQVIQKDAALIQRDYGIAVSKTTEDLRRLEIELANDSITTKRFNNELAQSGLELYAQSLRLSDSALMTKKFNQETQQINLGLMENAMKLKDAAYQQDVFTLSINKNRQDITQQKITLDLLSSSYSAGTISLLEYAAALGQVDEYLLSSTDQLNKALGGAQREVSITTTRTKALEELNAKFKSGAVSAKEYAAAANTLGGDTANIERMVNTYGKAKDQIVLDNEFIKKSISGAANTFSTEFTDAIMKGQFSLNSFKNFTTNILNDVAQRIIKRQFADPIATYLEQMAMNTFGKGGIIPTSATEGAVTATDSMTNIFTGLAGKTSEIFTSMSSSIGDIFGGMGDSLMSGMSSLFSWIMDGIGSIGSSMSNMGGGGGGGGGLFGSIAGMFSGGSGGGFMDSISSAFGGFFADGGSLGAGQWGIAGENGPEMISGPANVTPMSSGDSGPLVVNFNLNAVDTQTGTEFLIKNKAVITNVIEQAYNRRGQRGPVTA
jgi:hypothetical protein